MNHIFYPRTRCFKEKERNTFNVSMPCFFHICIYSAGHTGISFVTTSNDFLNWL